MISAAPASAHTVLTKITPLADARLTSAPTRVVLDFNETVSMTFATVVVTDATGVSVARDKSSVTGARVTQALSSDLASGEYRIAYRVVSQDGHPVSGESRFTMALPSGATPTPSTETSTAKHSVPVTATPSAASPQAAQEGWLTWSAALIAGTVGLVVGGAVVLSWNRRRRKNGADFS